MKLYRLTYRLGSAYSAPVTLPPLLAIDPIHARSIACREIGTTDVTWVSIEEMP